MWELVAASGIFYVLWKYLKSDVDEPYLNSIPNFNFGRNRDKLDRAIQIFSESLGPSNRWQCSARASTHSIFELLKRNSTIGLDRCLVVGGFEKCTSTSLKTDIDAVIYYNDRDNSISRISALNEWKNILLNNTYLREDMIRKTEFLLSFTYDGVDFDIVAVKNQVYTHQKGDNTSRLQFQRDLHSFNDNPWEMNASSQSANWMARRSKFCHDIARLAKFWTQTVFFVPKVWGMSFIFELLGVAAGMEEERRAAAKNISPSHANALYIFLRIVQDMKRATIFFKGSTDFPDEKSSAILNEVPLLVNPVDPSQNMLYIWKPVRNEFFSTFSNGASITLNRLSRSTEEMFSLFYPIGHWQGHGFKITNCLITLEKSHIWKSEIEYHLTENGPGTRFSHRVMLHIAAYAKIMCDKGGSWNIRAMEKKLKDFVNENMNVHVSNYGKHEHQTCRIMIHDATERIEISFDAVETSSCILL